jgi:hypothetical protein
MKIGLKAALTALLVSGAVALSAGSSFSAESDGAPAAGPSAAAPHRFIPHIGIPFAAGKNTLGTVEINGFAAQGGKIVANTTVRVGETARPAKLGVKILEASCHFLELQIDPPRGAPRPVHISQHAGNSNLEQSEFCAISHAVQDRNVPAQVAALNDHAGGPETHECPWYQAVGCGTAVTLCAASCAIGPEVCIPCLAAVGLSDCIDCLNPE